MERYFETLYYITKFRFVGLAAPMLSNANDIRPLIHVTNIHNGQYDEGLDAITETKFLVRISSVY